MTTRWQLWFVAPMVMALAFVILFPTVYLFWMSVTHWVITDPNVRFTGLGNFQVMFRSAEFSSASVVTATYLIVSTSIMVVLAMAFALAVSRPGSSGIVRTILVLPLVIPPVVAGFTWRFLLNGEMGFIGAFLLPSIGIRTSMLADPAGAMAAIVIADVWSRTPFMFVIFLAALQSIPREQYEAIRLDGANRLQEFWLVTLPLMRPAIAVALLFRVIDAINTFELIYVMTRGGPGRATQTFSILGWKTAFQGFDLGQAAALGVAMLFMTTICALIVFRRFLRTSS